MDFGPEPKSVWLINQLGHPSFDDASAASAAAAAADAANAAANAAAAAAAAANAATATATAATAANAAPAAPAAAVLMLLLLLLMMPPLFRASTTKWPALRGEEEEWGSEEIEWIWCNGAGERPSYR